MSREQLQSELEKWKRVSLVYAGVVGTLLAIALVELPAIITAPAHDGPIIIDGWYGVWFVLVLATLTPGIMLLLYPSWRFLPLTLRLNTGFVFLVEAWTALFAFEIRLAALDVPALFHFLVVGFGLILLVAYLLLKRKLRVGEEIFP
jgi:hypothetical protein